MMRQQHPQQGFTLVELMIATTLGMVVVLAITCLVIASKITQSTQTEAATIQDTARFALNNISQSVKQAGYVNLDSEDGPSVDSENTAAGVIGFDAGSAKEKYEASRYGIDSPVKSRSSSDTLALRFFSSGTKADNTILNCAGFGVAAVTSQYGEKKEPGWSIYYVDYGADKEPALFCKYQGKNSAKNDGNSPFVSQAIARGVESFQVLYGISPDSIHSNANVASTQTMQFHSATKINALDSTIPDSELHQKTHWKKITAIKVAMLIRGAENSRLDQAPATYNLFGAEYGNSVGNSDKGTQINESDLPLSQRKRLRKVVSTTIQLRNSLN